MLELLQKDMRCETLDAHIHMLFDTKIFADKIPEELLLFLVFMAPLRNFCKAYDVYCDQYPTQSV